MKNLARLILLCGLLIFQLNGLKATDYYVKQAASGNSSGQDWANAYGPFEFATALLTAQAGDIFHLAAGNYMPYYDLRGNANPSNSRNKTFYLRNGVTIQGGYDADGSNYTVDKTSPEKVVLSGDIGNSGVYDNTFHVVVIAGSVNHPQTGLRNLSITMAYANGGGNNSKGGGIFIGKNSSVTLSNLHVEYNSSNDDAPGIFIDTDSKVTMSHSEISNNTNIGKSDVWGGGIGVWYSELSIDNSVISDNTAKYGAGIHVTRGKLNSENNVYSGNIAEEHGGAIDNYSSSVISFTSDSVVNNRAYEAGGIHNEASSSFIGSNVVFKNNASYTGGAFFNRGDCKAEFNDCTFDSNTADNRGGGIENRGTMEINRNRIINNKVIAAAWGGGINQNGGRLTVRQSEISDNKAKYGAGVCAESGIAVISNTTISGNVATSRGGGVYSYGGQLTLIGVTVTNNTAPEHSGSGVYVISRPAIVNGIISGNYNNDDITGNLNESGSNVSTNNIIGADYFEKGNKRGIGVNFNFSIHLDALGFDINRNGHTRVHKLLWTGSSSSNPAVGKAKPYNAVDNTLQFDQTLKRRGTYPSLGAYESDLFKANPDIVFTEKDTPVTFDVGLNDALPATCTPAFTIIESPKNGTVTQTNPFTYTPNIGVVGDDTLKYRMQCTLESTLVTDEAIVIIRIGKQYDTPANIIDEDICMYEMPEIKFIARKKYSENIEHLNGFSMPLIGDLNGDGKPEMVGLGLSAKNAPLDASIRYVVIYNGQTGEVIHKTDLRVLGYAESGQFKLRYEPRHNGVAHMALADLDNDGVGEIVITETGSKGRVYALKPVIDNITKGITGLTKMWLASVSHKAPVVADQTQFGAPMPYISDLNGDGYPEVIVYNKIYDGETGNLLLELETLRYYSGWTDAGAKQNERRNYSYVGRRISAGPVMDDATPVISIIDIDDDGMLEIVAGMKIYKPRIVSRTDKSQNGFDVVHGPAKVNLPYGTGNASRDYYLTDGFTIVADIDGDDKLDIITQSAITDNWDDDYRGLITVWSPEDLVNVKAATIFRGNSGTGTSSIPFVGDINGRPDSYDGKKKLPEICITTGVLYRTRSYDAYTSGIPFHPLADEALRNSVRFDKGVTASHKGHIFALTYDASETNVGNRLKLSWALEHRDESASTGITMFDFDNDGAMDLAYRDEKSMRVISPSLGANYVKVADDETSHPAIRFRFTDNDKLMAYTGFEAPVIADINGDGSADIVSFSYAGAHGLSIGYPYVFESAGDAWAPALPVWNQGIYFPLQINTDLSVPRQPQPTLTKYIIDRKGVIDTIQPYNGSWIQQPIVLKDNYVPILSSPDPSLEDMRVISSSSSQTIVRLTIQNRGAVSSNAVAPVTFYRNSISDNTIIGKYELGVDIYKNEEVKLNFTLPGNYSKDVIIARLMDDNGDFIAEGFIDCDDTNNEAYTINIKATDDYYVIKGNSGIFDIRLNDTAFCAILPEIIKFPANGTGLINADSLLTYTTLQNFTGKDTLSYIIKCTYDNVTVYDTANVYLITSQSPDNIMNVECKSSPIEDWDFMLLQESVEQYPVWSSLIAGDIDADESVELIIPKINPAAPDVHFSSQLAILDEDLNEKYTINTPYFSNMAPSVAIANVDGYDYAAIFLTTSINTAEPDKSRLLIKYTFNGTAYVEEWQQKYSENPNYDLGIPYICDFNGDGNADILVYDKVFDAKTGNLLVDAGFIGTSGTTANSFGVGGYRTNLSVAGYPPLIALDDLGGNDKDGLPEVAAGNCIYKVVINSLTEPSKNTFKLIQKLTGGFDGPTSLADMNLDGDIDVVVMGYNGQIYFPYVWNPRTGKRLDIHNSANAVTVADKPLISSLADIDKDGYPEIIVPVVNKIVTFDFDNTGRITKKQEYTVNAPEGAGVVAGFDFDQDGNPEGVFKDAEQIRVVQTDGIKFSTVCGGKQGFGHPVVLDINQDHAFRSEIVVVGGTASSSETGTVRLYGGKNTRKAPARKVWNQYAYNVLNINENLTVPAYPLSNAINYPGPDNLLGTNDDVRPFNSYLQQISLMDNNGMPVYPIPNAVILPNPEVRNYPVGDSIMLAVKFVNDGAIPFFRTFYVSAYKNSITDANRIATDSIDEVVNVGDTAVVNVVVRNVSARSITKIIVRINDRGGPYDFTQQECEYGDNDFNFIPDFIANKDYALTPVNTPVSIDVFANDIFGSCAGQSLQEVAIGNIMKPKHGKAEIVFGADTLISYIPDKNFCGVDSFRYRVIDCNNIEHLAWVYVVMVQSQSLTYVACKDASVTLAMIPIEDVTYRWVRNNTTITYNANSIVQVKDASKVQPYHVKVGYKNISIGKYYIDLLLSSNCAEEMPTSECMINGTVLFKEDFGGNNINDARISPAPLPTGLTDYIFSTNNSLGYSENNSYWLLKYNTNEKGGLDAAFDEPVWHKNFSDHTYPNDINKGYMFMVDAAKEPGKFYEHTLTGLCDNTRLFFSVWIMNLMRTNIFHPDLDDDPDLKFVLSDENDNILATYITGTIKRDGYTHEKWRLYGFEFNLPTGVRIVKLKIYNNATGSSGNDFVMDDIEIRLCVPPATMSIAGNTTLCEGESVSFNASYTDDNTFGNNLAYRWVFKPANSNQWIILKEENTGNPINNASFDITNISKAQEGYYRFVVANPSTIDFINCCAASVPVFITVNKCQKAVNDTISVSYNSRADIDILSNDDYSPCDLTSVIVDTIHGTGLHHGRLVINNDKTFTYIPDKGKFGVDSVDYTYRCGSTVSSARIYIIITKTISDNYYACENAMATLEMEPISNVEYYWYNSLGTEIKDKANTVDVMKNTQPVQTFYVRCSYKGGEILNTRHPVELVLNNNCGEVNPTGCAVNGRLLFKEDFGGNSPDDPSVKQNSIPQVTGYNFTTNPLVGLGNYGIRKQGGENSNWYKYYDHTYPDDADRGYLMQFNASGDHGQFYECQIDDVCEGSDLYFSAWVANVSKISFVDKPSFTFVLEDLSGSLLAYYTGEIADQDSTWKQFGFSYTIPVGVNSVNFKILNNGKGPDGNNFVMDDVEIRLCVPPVSLSVRDTVLCAGKDLEIVASYTDDNAFGDNLIYRWMYRTLDNNQWTVLEENNGSNPLNAKLNLNNISADDEGYYKIHVANASTIGFDNCYTLSDSIRVSVYNHYSPMDVRVQLCLVPERIVSLGSYIDAVGVKLLGWEKGMFFSPDIVQGTEQTTADVNTKDFDWGTYMYQYTIKDSCNIYKGRLFVTTIAEQLIGLPPDTIVVCHEVESSQYLQLNQIAGFNMAGSWVYDNTVNPDNVVYNCVTRAVAPAINTGAYIFNAAKAWSEASDPAYLVNGGYNGDMNAKMFKFRYQIATDSGCLANTTKEIIVIVTCNFVE